jgi:hemerythrin
MGFMWRESYSVGNAVIDAEHRELFARAHAFFEAVAKTKKSDCALGLLEYTRHHFDQEEALMREAAYADISVHAEQHNQLIDKLNVVVEKLANDTLEPSELKAFLSAWLLGHIVTFDARLCAFLKQGMNPA